MTSPTGGAAPQNLGRGPAAQDFVGSMADDAPVFVISVAAELAGMHAQTLRQYDRLGEVQRLSQEDGVNLAGIKRIIDLESRVEALKARVHELLDDLELSERRRMAAEAAVPAGYRRDLVPLHAPGSALVVWRPRTDR
jgi:MerR family transcriptional regulator/heat shock protein HspR